jgi:hypothetical protein
MNISGTTNADRLDDEEQREAHCGPGVVVGGLGDLMMPPSPLKARIAVAAGLVLTR